MTRVEENPLAQYSFDASKEFQRLNTLSPEKRSRELTQNLRGYENEVIKDRPVSIKYSYWFDGLGRLYNHPDSIDSKDRTTSTIDPDERDGMTLRGFQKVERMLAVNSDSVVLWYSPAGRASFSKNPDNKYADISFDYGQLYVQHSSQDQVDAVAIKVTNEGILEHFMPHVKGAADTFKTEKERSRYFLDRPSDTGLSLEEFLNQDLPDELVHTSHEKEQFSLHEIMAQIRQAFESDGVPDADAELVEIAEDLAEGEITEEQLSSVYFTRIAKHMEKEGLTIMSLSGSCGGRSITSSEIGKLLKGLSNIYSTQSRLIAQMESSTKYPDYECPGCHQKLSGESKTDKNSWRKECEHCGTQLNC